MSFGTGCFSLIQTDVFIVYALILKLQRVKQEESRDEKTGGEVLQCTLTVTYILEAPVEHLELSFTEVGLSF